MPGGICQWTSNQCIVDTLPWDWEPLFRTFEFSKYFIHFQSDKFCSTNYDSSNMYNMHESTSPPPRLRKVKELSRYFHCYFKRSIFTLILQKYCRWQCITWGKCLPIPFLFSKCTFFPSSSTLPNCCGLGLLFQPKNIHPICFLSVTRWTATSATCTCHHEPHLEPK